MADRPDQGPSPARGGRGSDLALLLLLGGLWGSAFPIIRLGLLAGASPLAFGAARYAAAAGVMALIALARREGLPSSRDLALYAVLGGVFIIGGYAALLYTAEVAIGGGLAAILIATAPLSSAVLGYPLLAERIGRGGVLGIVVGFVGVVVISLPSASGLGAGELAPVLEALAAGVVFAIGSVLLRRTVPRPSGSWALTTEFAAGALLLGALALRPGSGSALPLNPTVIATLAILVASPSVLGYAIYFRLHHRVGPTRANLVSYVSPLAGLAVGILFVGETVGVEELAGFLLIVGGLSLLHRRPSGPRTSPASPGPPGNRTG